MTFNGIKADLISGYNKIQIHLSVQVIVFKKIPNEQLDAIMNQKS
jgi:hypothetical protein